MTLEIILLIALILISAFFSGSETGMMAVNRYRLQHSAKENDTMAQRILNLLKRPDRLLSVILLGNTFANIFASALTTIIVLHLFDESAIAPATIILTIVILVFAETVPKTIAALHAEKYARAVVLPLQWLLTIFYPIVWAVNFIANTVLCLLRLNVKKKHAVDPLTHEELRTVVYSATGGMQEKDKSMLLGIFDLRDVAVDAIMVPRNEIMAIDLNDDIQDIRKQIKAQQHTRIPLYRDTIDNTVGVLHLRKLLTLASLEDLNIETLESLANTPYFIPENTRLTQQVLFFQKEKERLALVVDEYGELQGLVTFDDILEEIVGGFTTDVADISQDITKEKEGVYLVAGSTTLRDLNRHLKLNFPTDGPTTLNGLILEHFESIPDAGVSMRLHGYPVEILHVKDNVVKKARITIR
ncbi:MAG: HlyC/CorC family transporter [Gammaproteobacteria bacterium]